MSKVTKKTFKDPVEEGHGMPTFTLEPSDGETPEGSRLEVRAKIDGIPAPKVVWRKGNWLSIDDGGRYIVSRDPETGNYSMTIKATRNADAGQYKVVAMNDYGEVTAHFTVKIAAKATSGGAWNVQLKRTSKKAKVQKTQEELEKEVIEILKTAEPKDYESICMQHGFYDFRYILHKLKEVKREEMPEPEFEAAKVLRGLRHVTVNDEGTAVFEIHMEQANPDRQLRWLKDGELVEVPGDERRHELRRVGNVYQLIIRNVRPEDAGTYTLEVGKERFSANLTIKERPMGFESELKDQKGTIKGRCVFECIVTRRNMKVTWLKAGKEIKFGGGLDRVQAVSEGRVHKLIIMELTKADSAKYTAKLDKLESSAELTVASAPVRFRNRLVDTEVKEKSTAMFECTVSNRDLEAEWFLNGKPIKTGGRYKITHVGEKHTLFFEKVTLADNAAKIEVRIGDAKSTATLNVNQKPIKVLKKLEDVKCRTGDKAEFRCEIDDADQKNVKWFKDDKEIKIDKTKYEVVQRGGKHSLVVKNIAFEDEGNYTFQVRGVRIGANLTCTNPPSVDRKFIERVRRNPLKFKAGTKARIVIPIIAKEPMTVSWTNGRVTLEERGRFHMENSATEAVVEVQTCKITDSGDYELRIANENGDVTVAIPVRIVDKPHSPSGEIKFKDIEKNSVTMSWEEPVNMDIQVDKYNIEMQVEGTSTWKKVGSVPAKTTSYKATGLATGKKHKFRVKSANDEGESEPLESDHVTPLEPDQPPKVDQKVIDQLERTPIVVNAGETATIRVPCQGNPPPSASWWHNEEEILPVKHHRAKKDSSSKEVTLQITKCNRTDNGDYEARIFNSVGGVLVKTKIIVNDVPAFMDGAKVKVDKVTPNEVKMSWDEPEDDGNQPVTGYDIEKAKAGSEKWEKIGETKPGTTNFTASKCVPGDTFVFRVKAKNSRGASAPISSSPVTCGAQVLPPTIDPKLYDELTKTPIRVKAGQTGRLKVPLSGEPVPTATWGKDGESLEGPAPGEPKGEAPAPAPAPKKRAPSGPAPKGAPVFGDDATVTFDKVTRKEVKMSWDAPVSEGDQPLKAYDIEMSKAGFDRWEKIGETKPGTTSFTAGSLKPGEGYEFRVKARNTCGASEPVTSSPVKTKSGPSVPAFKDGSTVKVDKVTAKEVKMSWDAPDDDGDNPITGYEIEKCLDGTTKWEKVGESKPGMRSFTASELVPGATYTFRVKARNKMGASEPVTSRPVVCGGSPTVPIFKTGSKVEVDSVTTKEVKMTWEAPEDTGDQPLTGYEIEKSVYGTGKWDKIGDTRPGTTGFTASNCAPGETYVFRVKAKNSLGSSIPVSSVPITTNSPKGVPVFGKDQSVNFDDVSPKKVKMSWDAPANDSDKPITGYEIEKSKPGSNKWEKVGDTKPGVTDFTAENCSPGETYVFRVKAKNDSGTSEPLTSAPVTCKPRSSVPTFKEGATVKVDKVTPKEVKMSWDAPVSSGEQPLAGYDIERAIAGTDQWEKVGETKPGTTGFTADNLTPGESYVFRVRAKNGRGPSKPISTTPVTCGTTKGVPAFDRDAKVNVDLVTPIEVKMSWKSPSNAGDSPVTGYEIEKSVAGTNQWKKIGDTKPDTTEFDVSNLAPGETYLFRVKAKNNRGPSTPILTSPVFCEPEEPTSGAPTFKHDTDVNVDKVTPNEVKMSWDLPAHDGDQPISGYDIESSIKGTGKWDKVGETKPGVTDFTAMNCAPEETYLFRVKAKNCHGSSQPTFSAPVTCGSKKGVPVFENDAKVKVDNISPKEVKMTWDAPANEGDQPVNGYDVEKSKVGTDEWEKVGETASGATEFTANNLAPNDTYVFRVKAKNERGPSKPITTAPVTPKSGPTDVPSFKKDAKIKFDKVSPNEVKMSWDKPVDDGKQPLDGFDIERKIVGTDKWEKVGETSPDTTGFTSGNLAPGETYVFRVKAKNCRGPSKPVTSAPVTTASDTGVPAFARDTKVRVDDISPKQVKMSWDAPANQGDQPVTGYDIEKSIEGTDKWEKVGDTKPGTTGFTANNLKPDETYIFRVKAKNPRGPSEPITTAPVTCTSGPTGVPTFKDGSKVHVDNTKPNQVSMTWDAPAKTGNQQIDGYDIEKSVAGTDNWEKIGETKADSTGFTARDLPSDKPYVFRVKAKNCRGASKPIVSAPIKAKPKSKPGVPVFDKDAKVKVDEVSPKQVKMSWDAPTSEGDQPVSGYDIEKSKVGTDKWEKVGETAPGTTGFTASNLAPGDTYVFRVKAKNERGPSEAITTAPVTCKSGPTDVPSFKDDAKVKFDNITSKEVNMTWDKPVDDGKQPLAGFDIERKIVGTDKWDKVGETSPDKTGFTSDDLAPGETYVFRVKANNCRGPSKPVTSAPVTTNSSTGAPTFARDTKVRVDDISPKQVKMSWDAPANQGDKPVTGYDIEKSIAGTDKWEKVGDTKPGTTGFTATSLGPGDTYIFRVKAKNPCGPSEPITTAPVTCKSGPTAVPTFKPGTKVTVDNSKPNEISMTWDAPAKTGDQPIDGYDIEKSVAGTNDWEKIGETNPDSTGFTAKNLPSDKPYVFRVKAKNCRGASKPIVSAPVQAKPKPKPTPRAPVSGRKAGPAGKRAPKPASKPSGPAPRIDNHRLVKDVSDAKYAQLIIHACERNDSGKYICKLKNEAGELEIPLNVVVVDAPQAPPGEIEFSDISAKGCTVAWEAPGDDGGEKVDHYVIEKKEEGRKNWTSVGRTTGDGPTNFRVKGVPSGKTYRFRVRAVNDIGDGESLESQPVTIKDPFDAPSKISGDIDFETATDDSISISWPGVENDGGNPVQGYFVEKRKKGQNTWSRCNHDRPIKDRKYTATGLRFESEYEFRVIAVNTAGEGIPSRPSQTFVARTPVEAPGEPSDIELIDSTNTSLTLAWKATEQQGGAELLGYEIEIREEHSEHWQLWTDGAINGTSCTLRGLKEGGSYHVRMRSVNRGARSRYYYHKGLMQAIMILMAPTFKMTPELEACVRDGFQINAGSTIRINVPYTGRPKPHIEWRKDGEELDETVELISAIGVDQMVIRNARGHHSGTYTISLSNSAGSETLKVRVKVFDVPTPPTGPIKVFHETDKGVTLTWNHPKYDGGKPTKGYVIQSRDARGRDWQTVAQNIKNCEYTIDSLHKSRSYYFRILAENEIGRSEPLECKTVVYIKQVVAKVQIEDVQYQEKDLRQPPKITVPMKPRIVPEGVKVTLSCSISGKPHPQIRWYKDNKDITDNPNYFKENVIGLCRLVIKTVKASDVGVYKVIAENPVGTATCQANLVVET